MLYDYRHLSKNPAKNISEKGASCSYQTYIVPMSGQRRDSHLRTEKISQGIAEQQQMILRLGQISPP